ncbi:MAG: cupin domain-containing protein [Dehalococcoidales bacterium]|nr:cupin domain-containing protein [Dehalococcoidales bacterium]
MQGMRADQEGRRYKLYKEWMKKEGIPVYETFAGVEDVTELPRGSWARTGGLGTFIELDGMKEAGSLLYVAEIPGGGALEPEKHLYDEFIYVLRGRGMSEVWQQGGEKRSFEWGEGSVFCMPLNAWHRMVNGGREPAIFFAKINAPLAMEAFRNIDFIFNCDYNFTDRFSGEADYFLASEKRYDDGDRNYWETNFIPDVRTAFLGDILSPYKVEGGQQTRIEMAAWISLHTSSWPAGMYHKCHFHGAGALILGAQSEGYVLIWHRSYGIHPYQDGNGDKVIRFYWKPGSIYSPPHEWFHQHFNTGNERALHLAHTAGQLPVWLLNPNIQGQEKGVPGGGELGRGVRNGGGLIEYEDEDPEIRRAFKEEIEKKGIKFNMKPVVYNTEPFKFAY